MFKKYVVYKMCKAMYEYIRLPNLHISVYLVNCSVQFPINSIWIGCYIILHMKIYIFPIIYYKVMYILGNYIGKIVIFLFSVKKIIIIHLKKKNFFIYIYFFIKFYYIMFTGI